MSKKLKAFIASTVTKMDGSSMRYELFEAEQFSKFVNPVGRFYQRFRMKVNGQWYERNVQISDWECQVIKFFTWVQFTALVSEFIEHVSFDKEVIRNKCRVPHRVKIRADGDRMMPVKDGVMIPNDPIDSNITV